MGDVPGIYARRVQRKPLQTLGHGDLTAAGRYAASICRDLGDDPTMAEAALADLAGLWIVLARRAVRDDTLHNAALATGQARGLLMALGLRRSARDVSPDAARDSDRPLRSTAVVAAPRAGNRVADGGTHTAPDRSASLGPAPAGTTSDLGDVAMGAPPPAATLSPTPTSATPPARADEGPSAQENRSHLQQSPDLLDTECPVDDIGEAAVVQCPRCGGQEGGLEGHACEGLCPECGQVLTPAGEGLPPLVCEVCGWPPVDEAADVLLEKDATTEP